MLNITSLNNLSPYINGFMERWIISLIDSVVNPFSTIRTGTVRFRLLRRTKSSEKRLVLAWRITYIYIYIYIYRYIFISLYPNDSFSLMTHSCPLYVRLLYNHCNIKRALFTMQRLSLRFMGRKTIIIQNHNNTWQCILCHT